MRVLSLNIDKQNRICLVDEDFGRGELRVVEETVSDFAGWIGIRSQKCVHEGCRFLEILFTSDSVCLLDLISCRNFSEQHNMSILESASNQNVVILQ